MREISTVNVGNANGIPFAQYNSIVGENNSPIEVNGKVYDGFYVSYNNYDRAIYGDVTTALVLGQMQKFYILTGNHCEQYEELINQGFFRCLEYFKANINQAHNYSDRMDFEIKV
ncbi:hypothetical protein SAMN02745136_00432 [Anaerocolumna jejuensis DSM 15929]|uniref:Uncharacterized protein n=1 Tax=Anaerocolumna jejuensis DSM 15929 TaxID=1121322 RepID=A0A1M6KFC2_9FIRM|nr:hypothetical protein [Anaerocolumna jejuensis]SHJ57609.1 hypothetical protein SAMN02745136_00432 [Anaerocolumna jejuensis DSM 15929]